MTNTHFHIGMSILGALIALGLLCLGACIGAAIHGGVQRWRERRAIAKRDADRAEREANSAKWGLTAYTIEHRRSKPIHIRREQLDPAHTTGQFAIPQSLRDKKGAR
jgi:hypothetical protein